MSNLTSAWDELYSAQTEAVGSALVATVAGVATSKPVIPSESPFDDVIRAGGIGNEGELTLQMRVSDFSETPAHNAVVTVLGRTLALLEYNDNNGIRYLTVGDPTTRE